MKSKNMKQSEAQERQEKYDALTIDKKLALIEQRRGDSKKERAKLAKEALKPKSKTEEKLLEFVRDRRLVDQYDNKISPSCCITGKSKINIVVEK